MKSKQSSSIDAGWLIFGLLIGLALGGVYGLLNAPDSGKSTRKHLFSGVSETGETLRNRIESVVPADPVAESMAEGKAAAARRRAELGLTNGSGH
jgi:gas vesicle protein